MVDVFTLQNITIIINKIITDRRRKATKRRTEQPASLGGQPESYVADTQESDPDEEVAPSASGPFFKHCIRKSQIPYKNPNF